MGVGPVSILGWPDWRQRWAGVGAGNVIGQPPRGLVVFESLETNVTVEVMLGNAPAQINGRTGGFEQEERFGLAPVLTWTAPDGLVQTIPVLFLSDSAEAGVARLRRLAAPRGRRRRPPLVRVSGRGVHDTHREWVIANLEPDDDVRRYGDDAHREWQPYVVTLWEHVSLQTAEQSPAKANQDRKKPGGRGAWPGRYVVMPGDTLPRIAKQVYGDARKWHRIAEANEIRDPRGLRVGRRLKIP